MDVDVDVKVKVKVKVQILIKRFIIAVYLKGKRLIL